MRRVRKLDPRRINEILLEGARGGSLVALVTTHGFSRADFRRWQEMYGMPLVYQPSTARQLVR